MTPNKNHCIPEQFVFEQVKSRAVIVNFKGKPVTSDAGLTLIAEVTGLTIEQIQQLQTVESGNQS